MVVVADAADVLVGLGQQAQPKVLRHVGVLVFVDHDVAELALVFGQDLRRAAEQFQTQQQKIAEIAGVQRLQPVLIGLVDFLPLAVAQALRLFLGQLVRHQAAVLEALEGARDDAGRPAFLVDFHGVQVLLDQAHLIVGVQDGEIGLTADQFGVGAQNPRAHGMKGADPPALDRGADQLADPFLHLARGLVGEGHGQDLPGPGLALHQDMGQPRGQHPRLARAGPGQDQHRAVHGRHGLGLGFVQAGKIGGGGSGWRRGRGGCLRGIGHTRLITASGGGCYRGGGGCPGGGKRGYSCPSSSRRRSIRTRLNSVITSSWVTAPIRVRSRSFSVTGITVSPDVSMRLTAVSMSS